MKINPNRFRYVFTLQTFLILVDIAINTFSLTCRKYNSILLIFFIVQDICLVLALGLLLLTFFSTYVFQAGLIELLYDKFKASICICIFYFVLTTVVYVWLLCIQNDDQVISWSYPFLSFYTFQRFVSPIYYYFYKRSAMKICDPRFYEDMMYWDQTSHRQQNR